MPQEAKMKKFLSLLLIVLLACTLAACGGKEEGGGEEESTGSDSLVIYSPNSDPLIAVAETFGEKYGINVEVVSAGTGECLERIAAERTTRRVTSCLAA